MKQISLKPHDYTSLQEWLSFHKLRWSDLAREIGVTSAAVSRYKTQGRHFPTDWIVAWRHIYKWSWEETVRLCLGGGR